MSAESTEAKGSLLKRGIGFWSESVEELRKVSTPSRQETMQATIVTVFIIMFASVCLFLLDIIFNWLMTWLIP